MQQTPTGWRTVRLGDVAEVTRGLSWSRKQESSVALTDSVPVVRIGNVQSDGFKMDDTLHISGVVSAQKQKHLVAERTLVMVGSNGNPDRVGNVFLANEAISGHILASFLIRIEPNLSVSERYLALSLRSERIQELITESTAGSTGLRNLSLEWLRSLPIPLPPLPEQRAIAEVLDNIDGAIERTDAVIAATERLRDSLLHELLTRGVPGRHTSWRDAPGIGMVPASWDVVRLGEVCESPEYGAAAPAIDYDPNLPRYVRITDLTNDGRLRPNDARSAEPTLGLGYELEPGDLLFARSGSVGRTYLYRTQDGPCVFAGYLIRFRTKPQSLLPEYLERWTRSQPYFQWIAATARRGAQTNINASEYASMRIPLPPLAEQQAIAGMLDAVDVAVERAREERASLAGVKASASEALLTGRVRVGGIDSVGEVEQR